MMALLRVRLWIWYTVCSFYDRFWRVENALWRRSFNARSLKGQLRWHHLASAFYTVVKLPMWKLVHCCYEALASTPIRDDRSMDERIDGYITMRRSKTLRLHDLYDLNAALLRRLHAWNAPSFLMKPLLRRGERLIVRIMERPEAQ